MGFPLLLKNYLPKIVVFCTYLWKKTQIKCVSVATASHTELRYWQFWWAHTVKTLVYYWEVCAWSKYFFLVWNVVHIFIYSIMRFFSYQLTLDFLHWTAITRAFTDQHWSQLNPDMTARRKTPAITTQTNILQHIWEGAILPVSTPHCT